MSLIIAAPSSGSGKTTLTLGILRALTRKGVAVRAAKSGPDYIDPQFHAAATGRPCFNLDAWAMDPARIRGMAAGADPLIIEGAMGLFDGAPPDGKGATADLARMLGVPVVLVVDAASMSQSIAPLVAGFVHHDPDVTVAGVILNKVGSPRHETMLRAALQPLGLPVLGAVHRQANLSRPSRHLGLVQAGEMPDLPAFLDHAADTVEAAVDLDALLALGRPQPGNSLLDTPFTGTALAHHTAIARDAAFSFRYAFDDALYRHQGGRISYFSPLADDPVPDADQIILPGGYPELHAATIAQAGRFLGSLRAAAETTPVYGECGGYMVLGHSLTDADGTAHKMAGLLDLDTSFAQRKLHLGYRTLYRTDDPDRTPIKAHEFHYATTTRADGEPLFEGFDAEGTPLGGMGLRQGHVCGSFAHIISRIAPPPRRA